MKLLITGFSGHIGSFFLKKLEKNKKIKKIYLIDNFENNKINILFSKKRVSKLFFKFGDLSKSETLNPIPKVDVVIHLASLTNAVSSINNYKKFYENNFNSFINIFNFCKKKKAKLIHISSTSVYGSNSNFVDEKCKEIKPQSPYAKVKIAEERYLKKHGHKIKYITLRFGTIAGVSEGIRFHTAINKFCFNASFKIKIPVWKTALNQYRPYLSLTDAYNAIKTIINKNIFDREIYNILSNNFTVKQILNLIRNQGCNIKVELTDSRIMNQLSYKVSKSKFEKIGVKLNTNIKKDIIQTLDLFKNLNTIR
tara:strand:- start:111 stop:1040 length:930 start_codon:yes stop_codon:yes gene_type:complete